MVCLLRWAQDGVYTIIKELTVKIAVAFGKRIFSKMGQLKYFLCLCAALHIGAQSVFGKNIVEIGKPDASAAEFNDFGVDFNGARYYFDETKTDPYEASKKFFASPVNAIFYSLIALLVLVRHRGNIARLIKGEESKISFKKKK